MMPTEYLARGPGGGGGGGGGGSGGHGGGGGGGGGAKGDLYGDQYVVLRDLDPSNGGGNGEPLHDANGQLILVGTNGAPIYFVQDAAGDYVIPPDQLPLTQTVELGRANVARAPDSVMAKSLDSALAKIEGASTITTDPAGRIMADGVTIDSPLENLALYRHLMTAGGQSSWPAVTQYWPDELKALIGAGGADPDWDPSSLLAAAFDKTAPISMDAVLYENTTLGVNATAQIGGELQVSYFSFTTDDHAESYTYDRAAQFAGKMLQWYANTDADPELEVVTGSVMQAVFHDQPWSDAYIKVGADPSTFESVPAENAGLNDFAQAVDDARAVIQFMHDTGATWIAG